MKVYIALFRGINVGGRNKLPMGELVKALEGLGLREIKTYIQSGNVVFQSEEENIAELSERMSNAIKKSHGFMPKTIILRLEEIESAMQANPYPEAENVPKTLHLYFLTTEPENPNIETLENIKTESERYTIKERVFYLHAPDGIGRSKLAANVEKGLGVSATARNWRSVCKIYEMAKSTN